MMKRRTFLLVVTASFATGYRERVRARPLGADKRLSAIRRNWQELLAPGAAVALYAATDDFTALHGVTASHAIAIVSPFVEDTEALSSWWFQALAAAYVTIGAPGLDDPAAPVRPWLEDPAPWDEGVRAGTLSDDEHVVKLVYSARALHEHAANPLLLAAAARQAGIEPEHIDPGDDT